MKATLIKITNIMGISDLTIRPGTITEITGQNGQGKTSIIEAIRSIGVKGHDATLIRKGETEGRIVIELDNGGTITKTIKEDKSERKYKGSNGDRGGASAIEGMLDVLSINPVEFLEAEPKRKLEILLESIDIQLSDEELSNAVGFPAKATGSALECMSALQKSIYDERTGVNRAIREKKATLTQLSETVPTNIVEDPTVEIGQLNTEIGTHESARNVLLESINSWKTAELQRINDEANAKIESTNSSFDSVVSNLRLQVNTLQEQLTQKGRFEQQKAIIQQMETQLEDLASEEESKTKALEGLKTLRTKKMESMPFPGLHILDGQITVNGIEFERLNTAEQVKFAINLAVRRAGDLKIICIDGLERLDGVKYEKFKDAVEQLKDYQFIFTRVTSDDLKVETA